MNIKVADNVLPLEDTCFQAPVKIIKRKLRCEENKIKEATDSAEREVKRMLDIKSEQK